MLKEMLMASYSFYGDGIGTMFAQWEQYGFFSYLLPFLLLFALIFGILMRVDIFKNSKGINGIIAFVVALMSLQFDFVSRFFAEIFPRLGVGLAIILVVLILLGIFIPQKTWATYTLFGIAAIVLVIVLVNTAGVVGWSAGWWWQDNWPMIAGAVFILAIVGVIVGSANANPSDNDVSSPIMKAILGK